MPSATLPARDAALATLVAVVWGVNFIAIDRGLASVPPLLFVALRFVLVCFPAVFLVPRPAVPWRLVVTIGLFMSLGQFALVYVAMHLGMPAGLTPLVLQSQVLLTVLFSSVALRERPTRGQLLGVLVGAAGLAVVAVGRGPHAPLLPLLLVVAAATSWAIGNVVARHARPTSGLSMVVWSGLVVPVPLLALSLLGEGPAAVSAAVTHPDLGALGSAAFTAYLASLLGYGLWNSLLARHPATAVVPFTMLVPVAGIAAAWLALGEVPTATELTGGLMLLAGVAAAVLLSRRRQTSLRRAATHTAAPVTGAAVGASAAPEGAVDQRYAGCSGQGAS
ncbi:O-acetylserine/cysteine efflux transporter [Oryzihumus leptocrescens]|uniref:O-acetylserine/cysteine efflux transporter n=1 Tax=Oryzihumus leptocrescens TaxID=297536 RepID=A0A542ZKA8_9MICO|nr:EamA family transporter [Oryzihumus leptocrescens]TQL60791.1 O-acetylserine/cysteine efflux transporter [Oryzihumus leptocrescens]